MKIKLECPYDFMDQNIIKDLNLSNDPECLIVNPGIDKFLDKKCFEIGTNKGYTTRILSFLFDKVKTVEIDNNLIDINQYNITNKNLHTILESNEFNFE